MALTLDGRMVRPLTADEVLRMVEIGILGEDERVELLDGVLMRMSPKSPEHQVLIGRVFTWLVTSAATGVLEVRSESPLRVPDATSLPEPDLIVLRAGHSPTAHPTTALLVVEVAVTSQATDLGRKQSLYAGAGVPESWVVDVPACRLVRFARPAHGRYTEREELSPPAAVRPLGLHVTPLDLAALFDGLATASA